MRADAPTTFEIASEIRRAVEHCCSFDVAYLDGDNGSPMLLTDYETGTVWKLTVVAATVTVLPTLVVSLPEESA